VSRHDLLNVAKELNVLTHTTKDRIQFSGILSYLLCSTPLSLLHTRTSGTPLRHYCCSKAPECIMRQTIASMHITTTDSTVDEQVRCATTSRVKRVELTCMGPGRGSLHGMDGKVRLIDTHCRCDIGHGWCMPPFFAYCMNSAEYCTILLPGR